MKRLLIVLLCLVAITLVGLTTVRSITGKKQIPTPVAVTQTGVTPPITKPTSQIAAPARLIIPRLGISASIEHVGMDAKGNMDVPKRNENVAWFEPGYIPGTKGSAVIAGHLDTKTGTPAVFYNLGTLRSGDVIQIVTAEGQTLEFTVIDKKTYPSDAFPLVDVFGPVDRPRLNLITCEGTYNMTQQNYSHRTVIYSELSS